MLCDVDSLFFFDDVGLRRVVGSTELEAKQTTTVGPTEEAPGLSLSLSPLFYIPRLDSSCFVQIRYPYNGVPIIPLFFNGSHNPKGDKEKKKRKTYRHGDSTWLLPLQREGRK